MNQEMYLLRVLDSEDKFCYNILLYDNKIDYYKAQEIIKRYDSDFYNEYREDKNWYDGLLSLLREKNLLGLKITGNDIIWVR